MKFSKKKSQKIQKFSPKAQNRPAEAEKVGPRAQNDTGKEEQTELSPSRIKGQKQKPCRADEAEKQVTEMGQKGDAAAQSPKKIINQPKDGA